MFTTSIKTTNDSKPNKDNENAADPQTTTNSLWNNLDSVKGKIGQTEFRRLWSFTKPELPWIMKGIACMTVSTSVMMSVPAIFGYIIDISTGAKTGLPLSSLSFAFGTLFAIGGIFNGFRVYCFSIAGHKIVRRIRHSLFDNITKQEMEFFDRNSTGMLISRLSNDTTVMSESMGGLQLSALLRNIAQCIGSFGAMWYLSPDLTVVMLGLVPFGTMGSILYGRFVKNTQQQVQSALSSSTEFAEEKILQIRTVRQFANENKERKQYLLKIDEIFNLSMLQTKGSSIFFGSAGAIGNLFLLCILLYGAHLVQMEIITSGLLTSALLYSVYVAMSALNLTSSLANIMKGIGASTRVFDIIDRESQIINDIGMEIINSSSDYLLTGDLLFSNVMFSYPTRNEQQILHNFNLCVPAGKAIAIVGESGSGKSTIFQLLLRFYDVSGGQIFIDGCNILDIKPDFIRNQIGFVSQEPVLFTGSIRDNITYGLNIDGDDDVLLDGMIERVAIEANAHEFILDFPMGYDTVVGEGGTNLSGGQKQRIAIARALIKNPSILLLDEATSALDAQSEALVADALQKSMKGRTSIIIAHRLSTIKNADLIAVLKGGQMIEIGTHEELSYDSSSVYSELVRRQLF